MAAASGDAHPWPIYNSRYRAVFPILDADGDLVTAAAGLDSEVSQDQGTFADATNEAVEIATGSGMYYLDFVATELDTKCSAAIVKTTTAGAKTTPLVLYPRRFPVVRTGTAQAGAATTITLDSGASADDDFYNGCYINITNDSPVNARGQARRITDYVGSTKVATVEAAWGTNPSSASTFEVLLTDDLGGDSKLWAGAAVVDTNTAGVPRTDLDLIEGANVSTTTAQLGVNAVQWAGAATATDDVALATAPTNFSSLSINASGQVVLSSTATGAIVAASFATGAIDNAAFNVTETLTANPAAGGIVAASFGAGAIDAAAIAANAITSAKIATDAIVATQIATGAITAAKFAAGAIDAAAVATGAIDADALATDAANEIRDAVWAQAMTEPTAVPSVTGTLKAALEWLLALARNKVTQTSTTQALRNDADAANIATSTLSDDGSVFTRGKWS